MPTPWSNLFNIHLKVSILYTVFNYAKIYKMAWYSCYPFNSYTLEQDEHISNIGGIYVSEMDSEFLTSSSSSLCVFPQ